MPQRRRPPRPGQGRTSRSGHPAARRPTAEQTHWGAVASWYDGLVGENGSTYHKRVVLPGVLRLLGLAASAGRTAPTVLDVACGQGVLCRLLAAQGAQVAGVDAAAELIEAAQRRNERDRLPVEYHVGDAAQLESLTQLHQRFDAVTCILAIQNIAVLTPVWRGCRAALKRGGRLVVVMMHPCFRIPRASAWGWEAQAKAPGGGVQYRRIDAYLSSRKTPIQMHPGSDPAQTTLTFHRPLQAYVNTLGEAGLMVDRIEEWPSHKKSERTDPKAPAQDQARREIPMFLALRARHAAPGEPSVVGAAR